MARGAFTKFHALPGYVFEQVIDLSAGSFKIALLNVGVDVILNTEATPKFGSGNLIDCAAGGGYTAGGIAITLDNSNSGGVYTVKLNTSSHPSSLLTWTKAAGSPIDIRAACLYLSAGGALEAVGVWDMTQDGGSTAASLVADDVVLDLSAFILDGI